MSFWGGQEDVMFGHFFIEFCIWAVGSSPVVWGEMPRRLVKSFNMLQPFTVQNLRHSEFDVDGS